MELSRIRIMRDGAIVLLLIAFVSVEVQARLYELATGELQEKAQALPRGNYASADPLAGVPEGESVALWPKDRMPCVENTFGGPKKCVKNTLIFGYYLRLSLKR